MLDKDMTVKVTNRENSFVGYSIPEMNNLHRRFAPGETKEIMMAELRALMWVPGGSSIIKNYLIVHNQEAVEELVTNVEPEYFYTAEDVEKLLRHGSIEQLQDCLDFAPEGVISLVKEIAVKIKLNDVQKRNAIQEKTRFNVTKAIEINEESERVAEEEPKTRRAAPITAAAEEPKRRTAAPAYEIVKK